MCRCIWKWGHIHKSGAQVSWLSMQLPLFRKPQTRMEVFLLDYGQLAWLALPQFPYLESEVQVAVLGTGEVKIFRTHPACGSSLQHMQRDNVSLSFFWDLDWGSGIGNHGKGLVFGNL